VLNDKYAVTAGAQFVGGVHALLPLREPDFMAARKLGASLVDAVAGQKTWPYHIFKSNPPAAPFWV